MRHIVVGMGQIGMALYQCLDINGHVAGKVDKVVAEAGHPSVYLHICIPGTITDFPGTAADYIKEYKPYVCIIHSTVPPGTTAAIQRMVRCYVAYSPVRGRHGQLVDDMQDFVKYVGSPTIEGAKQAASGLLEAGFIVKIASSARVLELSKLFQTTYTGLLVVWAQEMARYCKGVGVGYIESQLLCDMPNLPHVAHQPGFIGGHCIIPNLDILDEVRPGLFTEVIRASNELMDEDFSGGRLWPIPFRQNK